MPAPVFKLSVFWFFTSGASGSNRPFLEFLASLLLVAKDLSKGLLLPLVSFVKYLATVLGDAFALIAISLLPINIPGLSASSCSLAAKILPLASLARLWFAKI